jgi:hypothetical protein
MTRPVLNLLANKLSITASNYPNDSDLEAQILSTIKAAGGAGAADVAAVTGLHAKERHFLNLLANAVGVTASNYVDDSDLSAQILSTLKSAGGASAADKAACHALN